MLPAAIKPGARVRRHWRHLGVVCPRASCGVPMRVNVYAEEMTDRIEIIGKEIDEEYYRRVAARKKK